MECIFVYNPHSGNGKIKKKIDTIVKILHKKYKKVIVYETRSKSDFINKIRSEAIENKYDTIIFAGGDGTFNDVVQSIGDLSSTPNLAYIPAGTVNDVAHSLKIPRYNPVKAAKIIVNGKNQSLDIMRINRKFYAIYVVAAGMLTKITYSTDQKIKKKYGFVAYAFEALRKNMDFAPIPMKITANGETYETNAALILIMNGKSIAGTPMLNYLSSFNDGKIELMLIKNPAKLNFTRKLRTYMQLCRCYLFGHHVKADILRLKSDCFRIETTNSTIWDFDGEKGINGNVTVEVVPNKINLIVPKKLKKV